MDKVYTISEVLQIIKAQLETAYIRSTVWCIERFQRLISFKAYSDFIYCIAF